jgi:hypothetical protein
MVGDGDAVGIAAEILQDVLGSAEGRFGVDDPIFAEERTQPGLEELGMGERCEFSGQVQLTAFAGKLQAGDELAELAPGEFGRPTGGRVPNSCGAESSRMGGTLDRAVGMDACLLPATARAGQGTPCCGEGPGPQMDSRRAALLARSCGL